jgi:aspartyl protease family protein
MPMFQKLAIFATIAAGVAIGLLWPTAQRSSAAPTRAGGAEVVIERNSDHHYYADASVNGQSVHFMIDTGASETALTEADARAIGLPIDPSKYEVIGDGASGMVRGQYVQLKSIDLNGIRQQDAQAVVVPGAAVSLLGQPFLEKVDEIVIRQGEMRLKSDSHS